MFFAHFLAIAQPAIVAQSCSSRILRTWRSSTPPIATDALTPTTRASPPALHQIGNIKTIGRKANLVGRALSASTGTIDQEQIATRPLLRPAEVLEDIPGLVISRHGGGGKANRYYPRGFQPDHDTNRDATMVGVAVNLPSHAHGQGYFDINYLLPELVSYVELKKGLYFADRGDFAVAGGDKHNYRNTIAPTSEIALGEIGYGRFFTASSPQVGAGQDAANPTLANDPTINPARGGVGVNDDHFHPAQKRTVRVTLSTSKF